MAQCGSLFGAGVIRQNAPVAEGFWGARNERLCRAADQPDLTAELERRWKAVRAAMAERGIDVLVMQNSNEFSGGYVKWFTDLPSGNGTMTTVVFPKDDLMTVVAPGPFGIDTRPPPGDPVRRGVKRVILSPNFMGASSKAWNPHS